jgi:uncharacterized protein YndB with AHSA1/START domain
LSVLIEGRDARCGGGRGAVEEVVEAASGEAAGGGEAGPEAARVMTVDVVTEIDIERPVDTVASYAADPSTAPEWYANIESAEWRSEPPLRVGSVVGFVARFLGRRLAYDYEFVELVPGERVVMRTAQGPFPMETTYTWAPTATGGTHMTLRNRGEPAGFSRLVAPLMVPAMRRAGRKDLANLKAILERG